MEVLESAGDLQGLEWYYIVLPVVHHMQEPFEVVFKRLEDVRRKFVQSVNDGRKGKGNNFWSVFGGGMSSIEATHTKNGWNVHLNLIINAPAGTKIALNHHRQALPLEQWLKKVAEGSYVHDIQKLDFSNDEEIRGALVEVLKYSLKFSSLSNQQLIEVFVKTRGKRLFTTFGNMWGRGIKEDIDIQFGEVLDEEFVKLIYARSGYEYKKIEGFENEKNNN